MGGNCAVSGSSPLEAMLAAFQAGSGLCGFNMAAFFDVLTIVSVIVMTAWFLHGQFRQWAADRENGDSYFIAGVTAVGFAGLFMAVMLA